MNSFHAHSTSEPLQHKHVYRCFALLVADFHEKDLADLKLLEQSQWAHCMNKIKVSCGHMTLRDYINAVVFIGVNSSGFFLEQFKLYSDPLCSTCPVYKAFLKKHLIWLM